MVLISSAEMKEGIKIMGW